jgi:MurNAc alpha-1-phosphate uridylyltransferase
VINLSYRGVQLRERLGDGARYGVSIAYSDEGEPPLETAGGIVQALPLLGADPFLLVNSDVFTDFDFRTLAAVPRRSTVVGVANPPHHVRGDFGVDAAGFVTAADPLLTYAGIAVFDPRAFASLTPGRRPLKPLLDAAIARRELRGIVHSGLWLDVGTPERLETARAIARRR